ncbi:right-handed parallel beta-helix repeat-containing protein [Tunicatimonas pelagia]|uniref:right-handed parallel beta-helix repeat-containing protein n=1 Tax=Tunicatimonas pelagia TaxID=931531 RepID=UPI0026664978|nr:right-handed parallel beta-helix repeat-containing protein [Tunicatimonas pelagia]WKN40702.1 right-handed parallel beta-helix repeat-containing protein [Tunicatimonas pelagia]
MYVSTKGSSNGNGSYDHPFNTIGQALEQVKTLRQQSQISKQGIRIQIESGHYFLQEALVLNEEYSDTTDVPLVITSSRAKLTVLSGGLIVNEWTHQGANLYVAEVPSSADWYPKQLFCNGKKMPRASLPQKGYLLTDGPLSQYSFIRSWKPYQFGAVKVLRDTALQAFCGFQYQTKDRLYWSGLDTENAEIITYHSWDCTWQLIDKLDYDYRNVHLTSPSRYPVGFFSNHMRYRIENVSNGLDQPGEWYYNRDEKQVYFLAPESLEPNEAEIIIPRLTELVRIEGSSVSSRATNIRFEGITFQHNDYTMQFNRKSRDWYQNHDTWGYSDAQAAPNSGQAILVKNAKNITFQKCTFQDMGSYALNIATGCEEISITNNHFRRLGAGAILLGSQNAHLKGTSVSRNTIIKNNLIEQYGTIHPAGVGIWLANAQQNQIIHNEIRYGGYSGISLGWTWGSGKSLTSDNLIANNNIHHVLQELADGGGIYTLGRQRNTVIKENYIHHIGKHKRAIGAPNNGIFFDEGSRHITVTNNVLEHIQAPSTFRFNRVNKSQITLGGNVTKPGELDSPIAKKIIRSARILNTK